jgi:ATP-dependent Zn protease
MSRITLKQTAYHEAGHAVMAVWLRLRVLHVSIIPDEEEGSLGHTDQGKGAKIEPENRESSTETRFQIERLVLVLLAGNAAERILANRKCSAGSESDYSKASGLLSYLAPRDDEMRSYCVWLGERAKTILLSDWNWYAVETLANELLKQKYIGAKMVRQIVHQAWKDSCPTI